MQISPTSGMNILNPTELARTAAKTENVSKPPQTPEAVAAKNNRDINSGKPPNGHNFSVYA